MAIKNSQSEQINFLQISGARFEISRLPETTFYTEGIYFPTMVLPDITAGNPYQRLNYAASEIDFGRLAVEFKVDEKLKNFTEIFNWMVGLGFPESQTQYKELKDTSKRNGGLRSDASIVILTSSNNPVKEFVFRDMFPVSLGGLRFVTTSGDVEYQVATAVFSIRDFIISDVVDN